MASNTMNFEVDITSDDATEFLVARIAELERELKYHNCPSRPATSCSCRDCQAYRVEEGGL